MAYKTIKVVYNHEVILNTITHPTRKGLTKILKDFNRWTRFNGYEPIKREDMEKVVIEYLMMQYEDNPELDGYVEHICRSDWSKHSLTDTEPRD